MKTYKYLLGAFATLSLGVLASCSNDEPAAKGENTPTGNVQYMSVSITNVGAQSRAEVYEAAAGDKEAEITAENTRFYFFTEEGQPFVMSFTGVNGEVSNTNMVKPTVITTNNTDGTKPTVQGTLVLGEPNKYVGNKPAKVICIANARVDYSTYANKSIDALTALTADAPEQGGWDSFAMSNSCYYDAEGALINYTNVSDNIYATADEAKADPAVVYIERLAAKVRVLGLATYTSKVKDGDNYVEQTYTIHTANGEENTKLNVELQGWKLLNAATKAYTLKNIGNFGTAAPFADWNAPELHRSYWATSAATETQFTQTAYDLYAEDNQFTLGNFSSANSTENIAYCYENTTLATPEKVSDRSTKATAIIVKAVVKKGNDAIDLCRWAGDYYTEDALKGIIVKAWNDENSANQISESDVAFTKNQNNTWRVSVKDSEYDRFTNISRWQNGLTSFWVNIEHMGQKFGVVRNHIYQYTFTDVVGLGVPGNELVDPTPETESNLVAVIDCIDWHLLSKTLVLE